MPAQDEYALLPQRSSPNHSSDNEYSKEYSYVPKSGYYLSTTSLITILVLLVTSSSIALISTLTATHLSSRLQSSDLSISSLPRPNQFIGLENIPADAPERETVFRFPDLIGRISRTQPTHVFNSDEDKGRVEITPEDSMILQWQTPQDGVEDCAIAGVFPIEAERGGKPFMAAGNTHAIEVWNVTAEEVISPSSLNYQTRPSRGILLGTLNVTEDMRDKTHWFVCPEGRIQTVELTCPTENCAVEFLMNFQLPMLSEYLFSLLRLQWTDII